MTGCTLWKYSSFTQITKTATRFRQSHLGIQGLEVGNLQADIVRVADMTQVGTDQVDTGLPVDVGQVDKPLADTGPADMPQEDMLPEDGLQVGNVHDPKNEQQQTVHT